MKSNQKLWSFALASALTVSNLSALAFPITAFAADHHTITYAVGTGATGTIASSTSTTEGENEVFTTAKIENVTKPGYSPTGYKIGAALTIATSDGNAIGTDDLVLAETKYRALQDGELTVQWEADEYNIAYDLDGGTAGEVKPIKKTFDTPLSNAISDPTKANAVFAGWDLDGVLTTIEIAKGANVGTQSTALDNQYKVETGDTVTATAIWYDVYTITYDANEGEGPETSQTFSKADATITLKDGTGFTRDGYKLLGWSTLSTRTAKTWKPDKEGTTVDFKFNSTKFSTATTKNVTMYAVWDEVPVHTLSFDANGGTGTIIEPIEVEDGGSATLPKNTYKKEGYKLTPTEEWSLNGAAVGQETPVTDITADAEYVSNWVPITYTIAFDANGGSDAPASIPNVDYGVSKKLPVAGSMAHGTNTFLGWSLDPNDTEFKVPNQEVKNLTTEDGATVTFYAIWEGAEDTYTVKYDANEGTGSIAPTLNVEFPTGFTVNTNKNPASITRDHYHFLGWAVDDPDAKEPDYKGGEEITEPIGESSTITFCAVWEGDEYYVDFDPNDGTGSMATQTIVFGAEDQTLNKNAFSKKDCTFEGWGLTATATEPDFTDGQAIVDQITEDTVLYAIWKDVDEGATDKAKEAIAKVDTAAGEAAEAAKAADKAAEAANAAAEAVKKDATDENIANAKKAAEEATKAANTATAKATAVDEAVKELEKAKDAAGVDPDVVKEAEEAITEANADADDADEAAGRASTAAKTASDAATAAEAAKKKAEEEAKAADGSAKGTPAAAGTELVDANGNKTGFKVTDANASAPEVEYEAPADKNATKADIPETYTDLSGNVYKVVGIDARAFKDTKVKTVTIRKNIKRIDPKAFEKSKVKNVKIKGTKLTKKMAKSFKKLKKGGKIKVSGKHKAKNKEILNNLSNVKNGKTKVK